MAEGGAQDPCDTPSVRYLQSGPDTPHTCWFQVGKPGEEKQELIAGGKLHLMAHSVPLRIMLHESEIAEKGTKEDPVLVVDVKPPTFRNFVKFVHSNNIPPLSLEEAADLVYVADKYNVGELLTKIEQRIDSLLNINNVFVLLKRPECLQNQNLKNSTEKIIQQETKELFTKEEFLDLSSDELIHIVSQDTLAVTELELWSEMLRWAKHKAQSEEGPKLRESLSDVLKFMRFCTLSSNEFCQEVVPFEILTADEVLSINMIFGRKLDYEKSTSLCYELCKRKIFEEKTLTLDFISSGLKFRFVVQKESSHFFITTNSKTVQLLKGKFLPLAHGFKFAPDNLQVECKCKVALTRIMDYSKNTSMEQPVQFEFEKMVDYASVVDIDFPQTMKLLPCNKYKLEFKFSSDKFECITTDKPSEMSIKHEGLLVSWANGPKGAPESHLKLLEYKTL